MGGSVLANIPEFPLTRGEESFRGCVGPLSELGGFGRSVEAQCLCIFFLNAPQAYFFLATEALEVRRRAEHAMGNDERMLLHKMFFRGDLGNMLRASRCIVLIFV